MVPGLLFHWGDGTGGYAPRQALIVELRDRRIKQLISPHVTTREEYQHGKGAYHHHTTS